MSLVIISLFVAGMPICFCWNLAGYGRQKKAGWSLTLQPLVISG